MSFFGSLFEGGISGIIQGVGGSILGPIFNHLDKKQDATLEGFKTGAVADTQALQIVLAHNLEVAKLQLAYNTSWAGPKIVYMLVAVPAAIHVALVMIDSSWTFGTGRYGNLGIAVLPGIYATFEMWVVKSLFFVSAAQNIIPSFASLWMGKR